MMSGASLCATNSVCRPFRMCLDRLFGVGNKPILGIGQAHALKLQTQKLAGVFKANIAHDRAQKFFIVG
jgi:hypothetical protein